MHRIHTGFCRLLASVIPLFPLPALAGDTAPLSIESAAPAPAIAYTDAKGISHTLNVKEHKLTAVHFWATWCAPCAAELAEVDAAQQKYGGRGFAVTALSLDGPNHREQVTQFLSEHNIVHLTPYFDEKMAAFNAVGGQGLPTTLFIDASGNEVARADGPLDWNGKEVMDFIASHLK